MLLAANLTLSATAAPLSSFAEFAAIRGLKGIQLQASGGVLNYGNNATQPMTLADGVTSDVLPISHLNDLWVRGTGVLVIVFL